MQTITQVAVKIFQRYVFRLDCVRPGASLNPENLTHTIIIEKHFLKSFWQLLLKLNLSKAKLVVVNQFRIGSCVYACEILLQQI